MPKTTYRWKSKHNRAHGKLLSTTKSLSLTYTIGIASDMGTRRSRNEDSVLSVHNTWNTHTSPSSSGLFALLDGRGLYTDGQDATRDAIQAIANFIWPKIVRNNTLQPKICSFLLNEAIQHANNTIKQYNINLYNTWKDEDVAVMGTVTSTMIVGSAAYIANVGNCRTYLYHTKEGLTQITTDHTWVTQQVADGMLKPDDIYTHSHRNIITRDLGTNQPVKVDIFTVPLQSGDTLLLCSPGLWQYPTLNLDPTIEHIITRSPFDPSKIATDLIQSTRDAGGRDNISVLVISIKNAKHRPLTPGIQFSAIPSTIQIPPSRYPG